jgi:asparagine synthase (glutamine-hydrolysing)
MDGPFDPVVVAKLAAKAKDRPLLGYRDNTAFVGVLSTELWRRAFMLKRAAQPRVLVPSE